MTLGTSTIWLILRSTATLQRPPVGIQLFVAADIAKISVFKVEIWPFIFIMLGVTVLMMIFPQIVTIVPSLLM